MDPGHYAERAIDLVNAPLDDLADLEVYLAGRDRLIPRLVPGDLRPLRRLKAELATVVDASATGDERAVVDGLNALLERHPVRPRISGHDAQIWHLHVNDHDASVADVVAAEGLYGLVLLVTELGANRFGRCAATCCDDAFLDSSATRSKRFCSTRCASRTNVAAYRARRSTGS